MKPPKLPLYWRILFWFLDRLAQRFESTPKLVKKNDPEPVRMVAAAFNAQLAEKAFAKKDYRRVVEVLAGCEQYLDPIMRKRYDIAKKKVSET
jgi:hypothetical protein